MDIRYYLVVGAIVILAVIFIKKIWHTLLTLALVGVAYWYFFVR
ncbi:MAG: hypothetical protein Q8Q05_00265 [bacterium]|nr:hypothetical protein [bacterium]